MNKIAVFLAGGAAMLAAPALAQDATTFTGPRVEGLVGYDISRAGSRVDNDANRNQNRSIDGFLFGVGAGYDIAVGGNAIVGVEGELTGGTARTRFRDRDFAGFGLGRVKTGRDLYVGARAGFLASPDMLVYVKGGYTNARYNALAVDEARELRRNFDTDGWRIGGGAEMAFDNNIYAKLEYRYSNYSRAEIDFPNTSIPDSPRFDIDTDRHQVVAGVGVRF